MTTQSGDRSQEEARLPYRGCSSFAGLLPGPGPVRVLPPGKVPRIGHNPSPTVGQRGSGKPRELSPNVSTAMGHAWAWVSHGHHGSGGKKELWWEYRLWRIFLPKSSLKVIWLALKGT